MLVHVAGDCLVELQRAGCIARTLCRNDLAAPIDARQAAVGDARGLFQHLQEATTAGRCHVGAVGGHAALHDDLLQRADHRLIVRKTLVLAQFGSGQARNGVVRERHDVRKAAAGEGSVDDRHQLADHLFGVHRSRQDRPTVHRRRDGGLGPLTLAFALLARADLRRGGQGQAALLHGSAQLIEILDGDIRHFSSS